MPFYGIIEGDEIYDPNSHDYAFSYLLVGKKCSLTFEETCKEVKKDGKGTQTVDQIRDINENIVRNNHTDSHDRDDDDDDDNIDDINQNDNDNDLVNNTSNDENDSIDTSKASKNDNNCDVRNSEKSKHRRHVCQT